jgi:hypothetical protein
LVGVNMTGLPVKDPSDTEALDSDKEFGDKPPIPETDSNQSEGL